MRKVIEKFHPNASPSMQADNITNIFERTCNLRVQVSGW